MNSTVQWLIRNKDGRVDGPFTTHEVIRKIKTGFYLGEEFICRYPSGKWHAISYEESFFDVLLEVLEDEMGSGSKKQISQSTEEDSFVNVDKKAKRSKGKAVPEFLDKDTPLIIDVEEKKPKVGVAISQKKKKKNGGKRNKKHNLKKRSKRSVRAKIQWGIFASICIILYFVIFGLPEVEKKKNRIRLRGPRTKVSVRMTKKQLRKNMGRAITYFRKDNVKDYIKSQDALLEIIEKTNSLDAYSFLCMTYRELWPHSYQDGQDQKIVEDVLRRVQKLNPKSPSASVCLVVQQWVKGKYNDALRIMDIHLSQSPGLIFFNQMSGDIHASRREFKQAAIYFSRVRDLWSPPPVWSKALLQEARMYRRMSFFSRAVKHYHRLLKDNPQHSVAQIELGILEFEPFQQIDKAEDHIKKGLSSSLWIPKMVEAEAYVTLAKMNALKGDRKQALKNSQKAFSLDSSNQDARELIVNLGGLKALNAVSIDNINMIYIGEQYMKMGNYGAAQAEFRAAFEANQTNAFAALRAGQALWHLNQGKEAIAWVKKSVVADPRFVRSYLILADYMSARYDYINAIEILKQALKVNRRHHGIYRGFALVELRRRNYEGGIRFAEKALDLYDTDLESILILAKSYYGNGDPERAFQYIHRALELDPSNEDVHATYARILVALQGSQAGIDYLKKVSAQFEKIGFIRTLGKILVEEERNGEAIEVFNEVLSKNPKDKPTLMAFGKILQKQKDYSGARDFFLEAAAIDPSDAEPLFLTGQLYLESGQAAFALQQFERVIDVNSKYPLAHYYAGKAMIELGQTEKALGMAKEEQKMNPDIPESFILAGEAYYKMKQYPMCINRYQLAIRRGYMSAEAYIRLARCQRLAGALDAAATMLDEAEKKESGNPNIYKELGALYHIQGSYIKARESYQKYLQLNPQAKDQGQIKNLIRKIENSGE